MLQTLARDGWRVDAPAPVPALSIVARRGPSSPCARALHWSWGSQRRPACGVGRRPARRGRGRGMLRTSPPRQRKAATPPAHGRRDSSNEPPTSSDLDRDRGRRGLGLRPPPPVALRESSRRIFTTNRHGESSRNDVRERRPGATADAHRGARTRGERDVTFSPDLGAVLGVRRRHERRDNPL